MMKFMDLKISKFLLYSVINTGFTVLIYQGALFYFSTTASYVMAWAVGILFVIFVYPNRVFQVESPNLQHRLMLLLIYVLSFLVGLGIVNILSFNELVSRGAILVVLLSNFILNFFLSNYLLKKVLLRGK